MQHEAILILNTTSVRDEFNVTVNSGEDMQRLCRIVRRSEWTEIRQDRLDRQRIHSGKSVTGSIGMELDRVNKISTLCYRVTRVPVVHLVLTGHQDVKGSPEHR